MNDNNNLSILSSSSEHTVYPDLTESLSRLALDDAPSFPLSSFPEELLLHIFSYLPPVSIGALCQTSRHLSSLCQDRALSPKLAAHALASTHKASFALEEEVSAILRCAFLSEPERLRLQFLIDTLQHLRKKTLPLLARVELESHSKCVPGVSSPHELEACAALSRLSFTLKELLAEVHHFLKTDFLPHRLSNYSDVIVLHDHFDNFELAIRRHVCQIFSLFPADGFLASPSSLIKDAAARAVWEGSFGEACYFVPFRQFYTQVIRKLVPAKYLDRTDFINSLTYFINFPNDDLITPYKWHLLTRLFGPTADLTANFAQTVMQPGFVGLVNRIKAEELLCEIHAARRRPYYLLRFSRTATEFLVISSIDAAGHLTHRLIDLDCTTTTTTTSHRKPLTLTKCIAKAASGYNRIPMSVDGKAIVKLENLTSLAKSDSAYGYVIYCDSNFDDLTLFAKS